MQSHTPELLVMLVYGNLSNRKNSATMESSFAPSFDVKTTEHVEHVCL